MYKKRKVHFANENGLHLCIARSGFMEALLTTTDKAKVTCQECRLNRKSKAWREWMGENCLSNGFAISRVIRARSQDFGGKMINPWQQLTFWIAEHHTYFDATVGFAAAAIMIICLVGSFVE
jgi:hypothetical protein